MIALLQRAAEARVLVAGEVVAEMGTGLLVLLCAEPGDTPADAERLVDRLLAYRVFADERGRMNVSLAQCGGGLLLVPQFTLAADTRSGTRPGFSRAAEPALARSLFEHAVAHARRTHPRVGCGVFGAHMQVCLTNDGPVTLWLRTGTDG